jgi:isopenicillin-N N-acyltransferase like protein
MSQVKEGLVHEVHASGSPRELGLQYGRAIAALAHEVLEMRMAWCTKSSTRSDVLSRALEYAGFVEAHAPELLEEIEGLAVGAELHFDEALFLQVASEFDRTVEEGCSAIGSANPEAGPLVAQNWDTDPGYLGKEVVVHLTPDDRPPLMMFAPAGVIGYIGLNAHGVGHANNTIYLGSREPGLTGYFVTRKLLGFSTVREGLDWLREVPLGSVASYMLGDATGTIVDIELSGGSFREIDRNLQAHTNHYLRAPLSADAGGLQAMVMKPDSLDRLGRLEDLLAIGDEEEVMRALRDHEGFPRSVCRHEGADGTVTTASVVLRLARREMLVCAGNPCMHPYQLFSLN